MNSKDIAYQLIVLLIALKNNWDYDTALEFVSECESQIRTYIEEPESSNYFSIDEILSDYLGLEPSWKWIFSPYKN